MGLFDAFRKKKNEDEVKSEQKNKEEDFDIDKINARIGSKTEIGSSNKKSYEEQNRERERRVEEKLRKIKEAAQKSVEEKEREWAAKQKELENRKKEYYEETEKNSKEFFDYANKEIERMQRATDEITDNNKRIMTDIEERIKQTDNLPGAQLSLEVAREGAQSVFDDVEKEKRKELLKKYKSLERFYERIDLRIYSASFNLEQKKMFTELTQEQKDSMHVPYIIEKMCLDEKMPFNVTTKEDIEEFKKMSKYMTEENYTSGIELLSSFGVLDITDEEMFSASFNLYSLKTRDEIKRQSELSGMFGDKKDDSSQKGDSNTK